MRKNKLGVVIRHEYLTILRQPSFWISLIAIPAILLVIVGINYFTSSDRDDSAALSNNLSVSYIDESGLIVDNIASELNLASETSDSKSERINDVEQGDLDALIVYPEDVISTGLYTIYVDNTEDANSEVVSDIAKTALQQSVLSPLGSQELAAIAITGGQADVQAFRNGEPAQSIVEYIVPGSFLVIFYIVLVFSVSYALTSVSDEKENRSIEMVLSYVPPQTLIIGKLFGVILVTLTQIAFFIVLGIIAYVVARSLGNDLSLPFSLSDLTFDPVAILFGASFLVFGFIFYVAVMAMIGAIFPSSKEAAGFSTIFFILPAAPFWGFNTITNDPTSSFTQVVTYIPFSAPTASLLRNTVGNLPVLEGLLSLSLLIVATFITIWLAGRAFRIGTLEFNSRIKFADLFRSK